MRPGVNDAAGETQPLGALELVGEGVHGTAPCGVVRRAEMDQVARVGKDVAVARLPARRVKGADLRVRHRPGVPLALVRQEELHGAGGERPSAVEGAVEAARDRHVGAELVARPGHGAERSTRRLDPAVPRRHNAEESPTGRWKEIGMEPRAIASSFTTMFTFDYGMAEADMRRLYENAKRDQWNAARGLPRATPPPSDGRAIADELIDQIGRASCRGRG